MDKSRDDAGKKAAMIAIASNCLLTILNITVGLMGGSYALFAEGLHTFSDIVTSIIAYVGFKVSQKPANERFPEGYGRAEALFGLIIVIFLAFISFEIMDSAYDKMQNLSMIAAPDYYVVAMAVVGICLNFVVSRYLIKVGREINSPLIEADGQHQKTDIYTSITILAGIVAAKMGFTILDPIIGFLIGILVLKVAFDIGKKNIMHIMGFVPDNDEIVLEIKRIAEDTPNASNAHNIRIDNFASYLIVSLHMQVDANLTFQEAYDISCHVEENILKLPEVRYVSVKPCPHDDDYDDDDYNKIS